MQTEAMQTEATQPGEGARFHHGQRGCRGKNAASGNCQDVRPTNILCQIFQFFFFLLFLHLLVRKSVIITSFYYSLATENCFRLTNLLITFSVVDLIVKTLHLGIFRLHKINSGRAVHHTMSLIY